MSVKVIKMPEILLLPLVSESAKVLAIAVFTGIIALIAGIKIPRIRA